MTDIEKLKDKIEIELYNGLLESLKNFFEKDQFLLENGVHEQGISHKIACYLSVIDFGNLFIDVEYNKTGKDPKQFKNIMSKFEEREYNIINKKGEILCKHGKIIKRNNNIVLALIDDGGNIIIGKDNLDNKVISKSKGIRPDIIIHNRGDNSDNYCIFEIKKGDLSEEDKLKLEGFTDNNLNFGYKYGIGLSNFYEKGCNITLYIDGIFIDSYKYNK